MLNHILEVTVTLFVAVAAMYLILRIRQIGTGDRRRPFRWLRDQRRQIMYRSQRSKPKGKKRSG
jgi:hypothetical protein